MQLSRREITGDEVEETREARVGKVEGNGRETSPANRRFSSGKAGNRPGGAQEIVAIGGV